MGTRKRRTEAFLAQHPLCIFGGGIETATTRDHVPSRQLFHLRAAPEGYEFPSCERCNQATKDAEQVVSMLGRMLPDPATDTERREMRAILRAVRNNYPDVLREMTPSEDQVRDHAAKPWVRQLVATGRGVHPLALGGPLIRGYVETYARKLFTALHYKEFRKIIPVQGGIIWRFFSNVQSIEGDLPDELLNVMNTRPTIQRTRRDLSDQFFYTYVKVEDAELTAYFATFRQAFAILGFVDMDAEDLAEGLPGEVKMLRPLGVQVDEG